MSPGEYVAVCAFALTVLGLLFRGVWLASGMSSNVTSNGTEIVELKHRVIKHGDKVDDLATEVAEINTSVKAINGAITEHSEKCDPDRIALDVRLRALEP